jgi:hypothetical protein
MTTTEVKRAACGCELVDEVLVTANDNPDNGKWFDADSWLYIFHNVIASRIGSAVVRGEEWWFMGDVHEGLLQVMEYGTKVELSWRTEARPMCESEGDEHSPEWRVGWEC